jgi:hypothetical protein
MVSRDPTDEGGELTPEQLETMRRREVQEEIELQDLLKTRFGRAYLWRLMGRCSMFSTTFVAGQPDTSAFMEGQRHMVLKIYADIGKADPAAFALMQAEAKQRDEAFEQEMQNGRG